MENDEHYFYSFAHIFDDYLGLAIKKEEPITSPNPTTSKQIDPEAQNSPQLPKIPQGTQTKLAIV